MNDGVTKPWALRSHTASFKALQDKFLETVAATFAGLSPSHGKPSEAASGDIARDTVPVGSTKRHFDVTSAVESPGQVSPPTSLQKRRLSSDGDENEHQWKRGQLTRRNLALFNKMAEKRTKAASAPPESTADPSSATTTATTTSGFAICALKNGILNPLSSKPPINLEEIRERVARSRGTASPTESVFEDYVDTVEGAINEATMVFEVGGKLLKDYPPTSYTRAFNQAFTGFPKDVGFNNGLSASQPDFIEGLRMQEFRPNPVDDFIQGAVTFKENTYSVTLPHLAGEWKGRGWDIAGARLQSAYGGAALVYARNQALSHLRQPEPLGQAEVTTFTTDGTTLNLFAHYATPSEMACLNITSIPSRL